MLHVSAAKRLELLRITAVILSFKHLNTAGYYSPPYCKAAVTLPVMPANFSSTLLGNPSSMVFVISS